MNLQMVVYDNNGATRGQMRMKLDFGGTKWNLVEDAGQVWTRIGASASGDMDVKGSQVGIKAQPAGKPPGTVLLLSNVPQDGPANAGTGKIVTASDPSLSDGYVFWAYEEPVLTPVRKAMQAVLRELVPKKEMSSDDPLFKKLTGYDTQRLLDEYWEPENKQPPWKEGTQPKKNTSFTCCNLTLGCLASQLGNRVGKRVGRWLGAGVLQLDWADKDVKGSWVPSSSGRTPQVGDFYSVNHGAQKFGHVGTIAEITEDGAWTSCDGGQGGYVSANKKDWIKKVFRGKLDPSKMNGWVDIDAYFGS
jgi:hypothetical protein